MLFLNALNCAVTSDSGNCEYLGSVQIGWHMGHGIEEKCLRLSYQ